MVTSALPWLPIRSTDPRGVSQADPRPSTTTVPGAPAVSPTDSPAEPLQTTLPPAVTLSVPSVPFETKRTPPNPSSCRRMPAPTFNRLPSVPRASTVRPPLVRLTVPANQLNRPGLPVTSRSANRTVPPLTFTHVPAVSHTLRVPATSTVAPALTVSVPSPPARSDRPPTYMAAPDQADPAPSTTIVPWLPALRARWVNPFTVTRPPLRMFRAPTASAVS